VTLYQTFDGPSAKEALKAIFGEDTRVHQQGTLMGCVASHDATGRAVTGMATISGYILLRFGQRATIEGNATVLSGSEIMTLKIEPNRHPGYPSAMVAQLVCDFLLGSDLS